MSLDNSKFRELLATQREEKEAAAPAAMSAEERARKKAKQQESYERRMAIQKRREEALAEASRYTDRAAARRTEEAKQRREDGPESFYDAEEAEAPTHHLSDGPTFAQLGDREDLSQQQHRVSITQSKYLGGDIEHTHLVKGLDFALLQKMRSELSAADAAKLKKEEEERKRAAELALNELAAHKAKLDGKSAEHGEDLRQLVAEEEDVVIGDELERIARASKKVGSITFTKALATESTAKEKAALDAALGVVKLECGSCCGIATHGCDDCGFNFCFNCMLRYHKLGSFKEHKTFNLEGTQEAQFKHWVVRKLERGNIFSGSRRGSTESMTSIPET